MSDEIDRVVKGFVDDLRNTVRESALGLLGPQRTPGNVFALARNVLRIFDVTAERMSHLFPPAEPVACAKGCSFCCHLLFFTDVPSVFLAADELKQNLEPRSLEELKVRLTKFEDADHGLHTVPRPPCPLLVDDLCQAYDVRPLVCRAQNSLEVSQCEEKYEGKRQLVTAHDIPITVWTAIFNGLAAGLGEIGFDEGAVEFSSALKIAIEVPEALERWLAGEPIFVPAQPMMENESDSIH